MDELVDLERQGWTALSTEGDAGRQFYASVLREDAVMLFPGGLCIMGREDILQSLGTVPWETFEIDRPEVIAITPEVAALVYRVVAQRRGSGSYRALVSSTYVRGSDWQLVVHQQTSM
jgi:hypothetical protein